MMDAGPKSS
jgi:hypothetical protein